MHRNIFDNTVKDWSLLVNPVTSLGQNLLQQHHINEVVNDPALTLRNIKFHHTSNMVTGANSTACCISINGSMWFHPTFSRTLWYVFFLTAFFPLSSKYEFCIWICYIKPVGCSKPYISQLFLFTSRCPRSHNSRVWIFLIFFHIKHCS